MTRHVLSLLLALVASCAGTGSGADIVRTLVDVTAEPAFGAPRVAYGYWNPGRGQFLGGADGYVRARVVGGASDLPFYMVEYGGGRVYLRDRSRDYDESFPQPADGSPVVLPSWAFDLVPLELRVVDLETETKSAPALGLAFTDELVELPLPLEATP